MPGKIEKVQTVKKVFGVLVVYSLYGCSSLLKNKHLEELNKAYPYALIGDDFNILSLDDLVANSCRTEAMPFPSSISYAYWQCYDTKNVHVECDHGGVIPPEIATEAFIVLVVNESKKTTEYIARRPSDLEYCNVFKSDFGKLTLDEEHICVSGPIIEQKKDQSGRDIVYWVFDRYKTRKGCDSYFEGECDLNSEMYSECELIHKY